MITHPEKVLFPAEGREPAITKGELAAYYESMAPVLLPHIRARPITMERYPAGISKKGFIQKDVSKGFPEWLQRVEVPKKDGTVHHPLVTDTRSLLWIVNQNTITPHVWTSRAPDVYHPDICVFDLDPSKEDEPDVLRTAALRVRDLLEELGLPGWVKTSGSKGSTRSRALRTASGPCSCSAIPRSSRRSSTRAIAAAASWSTPEGTAGARRSPRPTRCGRSRARRCRLPARGTRSNAARSRRARSR